MGCQDRPGELKTNALTVTNCPRLGTGDSDVGGNRYTNWNLWHQGRDNFESDLEVAAMASLRLRHAAAHHFFFIDGKPNRSGRPLLKVDTLEPQSA